MRRRAARGSIVYFLAASSLIAALPALGCKSGDDALSSERIVVSVQVATAKIQPITHVVTAQGVLFPLHQASLSPKITAPVRAFYVNRGSRVHRGQLLATLENKDLAAGVVSAQGSYDQAQATYASTTHSTLPEAMKSAELSLKDAQTALDNQQKVFQSENHLFEQGALARKQLDDTRVALQSAQSAFEAARQHLDDLKASGASELQRAAKGQLESAHGQLLSAQAQLDYSELRSPIDGFVTDRAVYPGDIAPAGTPLLVVMDISKVIVRLHIPQNEAADLSSGDRAIFQVPGRKDGVPAKVTILSPALDPNSTTVEVWVEADNATHQLQPGTSVSISIETRTVRNALVVPAAAILAGDDQATRLMVVGQDGRAYSRDVTTGIEQGGMVQILSGLKPGEQVIVSGAYGLPDNTRVKVTSTSRGAAASDQGRG
jgi:HlyD family secretion protein